MASGRTRVMTGTIVGTGSAINIRTVGFRPVLVEVYNVTDLCFGKWTKTMADAAAVKVVTAGTVSFVTSDGITPLSNGFTFGADSDLNAAAETVHWIAYE